MGNPGAGEQGTRQVSFLVQVRLQRAISEM